MIDIKNGVLVYRVWSDGSNELVAQTAYPGDARVFAKAYIASYEPLTFKVFLVNTYDGTLEVYPEGKRE